MVKKSRIEDWKELLNWDALLKGKKKSKKELEDELAKLLGIRKIPLVGPITRITVPMSTNYIARVFASKGLVDHEKERALLQTQTFIGYNLSQYHHFPGISMFDYVFDSKKGEYLEKHQLRYHPLSKRMQTSRR